MDRQASDAARENPVLQCIMTRQSVMPKRLGEPGPNDDQLQLIVASALTVPDHAGLRPWRFVHIPQTARPALAEVFIEAKQERAPLDADGRQRERDKAMNAPTLIAVVARIDRSHPQVPASEQYVSVGAAIHSVLLSAHTLGFSGIVLSGERVRDPVVRAAFGLAGDEELIGFVSLGTPAKQPVPKARPAIRDHLSTWTAPISGGTQ